MNNTGHKKLEMPDGKTLVEWITPTVMDESRQFNVEMPTPEQMAVIMPLKS